MERFKDGFRHFILILSWLLAVMLAIWLTSCSPIEHEDYFADTEPHRVDGFAFPTLSGSDAYIQHVYLNTSQSYTYTQIYAESTDMAESQKYNGEANIHARFSTDSYWGFSDGTINDYPVYYVYPTSVRFTPPSTHSEYRPRTLDLWTKQLVGPIPRISVIRSDSIKIYMNVSYDGIYHVKDSILLVLHAKL